MTKKLIRFDWAVKNILRNKANFDVLEGFISELLFDDIKILRLLESEGNQEDEKDKFNRVDILVESSNGEMIIVEVQNDTEWDFFHRVLYGTSKLITEYLELGKAYSNIKKVISISVVYFDLGVGTDYIYRGCTNFYGLHHKDPLKLSEKQQELLKKTSIEAIFPEYYLIKPDSFDDKVKNTLDEWVYFLKNSEIKPHFTAKGIQEAQKRLNVLDLPTKDQKRYKRFLEGLSYEASVNETRHFQTTQRIKEIEQMMMEKGLKIGLEQGIEQGKELGKKEGLEQGLEKGKELGKKEGLELGKKAREIEIARNLLKINVDIAIISASTGLSVEEIKQIEL
jgi:predicted transposase/invertase (TIGR01784 family)